jgi:hypothetical protein
VAEEDGVRRAAEAIRTAIRATDDAVRAVSGRPGSTHPLIIAVREAGRFLNEVTHHAHVIEELPPDEELNEALHRIHLAVRDVMR